MASEVCLPRHLGDCLFQTPAPLALLIWHTLTLSPCTRVKPALQLKLASGLLFLPSVNLTYVGADKGGQLMSVNIKHISEV